MDSEFISLQRQPVTLFPFGDDIQEEERISKLHLDWILLPRRQTSQESTSVEYVLIWDVSRLVAASGKVDRAQNGYRIPSNSRSSCLLWNKIKASNRVLIFFSESFPSRVWFEFDSYVSIFLFLASLQVSIYKIMTRLEKILTWFWHLPDSHKTKSRNLGNKSDHDYKPSRL